MLHLAATVDVAIEGFRPGVADRLGVGYDRFARRESLDHLLLDQWLRTGRSDGDDAGSRPQLSSVDRVSCRTVARDHALGVPVGDLAGGAYAAMAISAALGGPPRRGEGAAIDVSMADVLLSWAGPDIGGDLASREAPGVASRIRHVRCADGFVTLGVVSEDPFWVALCDALGLAALDARRRLPRRPRRRVSGGCGTPLATRLHDDLSSRWSQPAYRSPRY